MLVGAHAKSVYGICTHDFGKQVSKVFSLRYYLHFKLLFFTLHISVGPQVLITAHMSQLFEKKTGFLFSSFNKRNNGYNI